MATPLRLSDQVGRCRCGDVVMLLDLTADRYYRIGGSVADWLASGARTPPPDDPAVAALVARGLLIAGDGGRHDLPPCPIAPPTRDILAGAEIGAPFADVVRAAWLQLRMRRALTRRPLAGLLASLDLERTPKISAPIHSWLRATAIAAAFARSALVIGSADRCLARSIALVAMAHRSGIRPALVFGVNADPFAAHCWAQLDDAVLTGDCDAVRQFTPILALT